jgi:hypothetical protein
LGQGLKQRAANGKAGHIPKMAGKNKFELPSKKNGR